jgi:hypothetical protein
MRYGSVLSSSGVTGHEKHAGRAGASVPHAAAGWYSWITPPCRESP